MLQLNKRFIKKKTKQTKHKAGGLILPDVKSFYKSTVGKTVWDGITIVKWTRIGSSERA